MGIFLHIRLAALFVLISSTCVSLVHAVVTPFLEQSFFFDYSNSTQPFTVPVTKQCDTININWERSTATGPNPVSPYYLQVYTTAYIIPFIIPAGDSLSFDWQVPFAPGNLYQICMFDKNGNTGGCQATYTMIPADSTSHCPNITFNPILDVDAEVDNGPMSQYGWIDQCTDISVTPKNGTPPYTLTVAPPLHPPYNITQNDMKAINWTVSLSWGTPFFISLVDSVGNMWSNGLLHSGGGGSTECLAATPGVEQEPKTVKPAIAIGSGIGGLVVGLFLGALSAFVLLRCHRRRDGDSHPSVTVSEMQSHTGVVETFMNRTNNSAFTVEPFLAHPEHGQLPPGSPGGASTYTSSAINSTVASSQDRKNNQNAVYVMHHDSGRAPVTVFHEDGTQVVELPPRYPEGASPPHADLLPNSHGSSQGYADDVRSNAGLSDLSEGPAFLQQHRHPEQARKPASKEASSSGY
ncbi:hypothetical protein BDQ17DRAFT_1365274 [Cyathus striatus]|nr:hypothetical protein BDQ17DRAFT_1365274 [Cyathus striatus]